MEAHILPSDVITITLNYSQSNGGTVRACSHNNHSLLFQRSFLLSAIQMIFRSPVPLNQKSQNSVYYRSLCDVTHVSVPNVSYIFFVSQLRAWVCARQKLMNGYDFLLHATVLAFRTVMEANGNETFLRSKTLLLH